MDDPQISILSLYRILRRYSRPIVLVVSGVTLVTFTVSLFQPKVYRSHALITSTVSILNNMTSMASSQIGALLGNSGLAPAVELRKIEMLLRSRTFAERVARRFNLAKTFENLEPKKKGGAQAKVLLDAEDGLKVATETLMGMIKTRLETGGDSMRVIIDSPVAELAPELVDAVLNEINRYMNDSEMTAVKKHRIFVGQQLMRKRRELLEAGKELSQYYQKNRISPTVPVVDVNIAVPEMDTVVSPLDAVPDVEKLSTEPETLEDKLEKIDKGLTKFAKVTDVPQRIYLEYLEQRRSILHSLSFVLSEQYEMALIDESRNTVSFRIIDGPVLPAAPIKPTIKKNVLIAVLFSFFLAVLLVLCVEHIRQLKRPTPPIG